MSKRVGVVVSSDEVDEGLYCWIDDVALSTNEGLVLDEFR